MKIIREAALFGFIFLLSGCGSSPQSADSANAAAPALAISANEVVFPPNSPKLTQIKLAEVTNAQVPSDEVVSPGKVEANPNRTSHVALPLSGRVVNVFVRIGDFVRQGQPLLQLDSSDVDAALSAHMQALASVTSSKSALVKSQADLDRSRDLFAHDAVAQKEVLNAEAVVAQSKAALDQAEASAEQTKRRLEMLGIEPGKFGQHVTVASPISGKVLEMTVVQGEYRNDVSQPLITIADLSTVWMTADVPESSIRTVNVGERVSMDLSAFPGETFTGRVKQIADLVDPQTRTIKVRVEMENRGGRLRPEMFGRIHLADGVQSMPIIPASAVVEGEGQKIVWREASTGRFQRIKISTGARVGDKIAVVNGLNTGDKVVSDGVMLLQAN